MARRNLEKHLQVGKCIEKGKPWPEKFSKVDIIKEIPFDSELGGIWSLQYSFDGETLAVGYGNGAIRLFNSTTGELLKKLRKTRYGGFQIMCLRFHPKEHHILLAGTSEGLIFLCNTQDGTLTEKITEKNNEINCLDFDCEGFNFATAGKDLNVRIYDTKTFQLDKTYGGYDSTQNPTEIASCAMRVFSLKYHPDKPNIFVTGGWENHLKMAEGVFSFIDQPIEFIECIHCYKHFEKDHDGYWSLSSIERYLNGISYTAAGCQYLDEYYFDTANVPCDISCPHCDEDFETVAQVTARPVWNDDDMLEERVPDICRFEDVKILKVSMSLEKTTSIQECFKCYIDFENLEDVELNIQHVLDSDVVPSSITLKIIAKTKMNKGFCYLPWIRRKYWSYL
ncbi:unnamed protein product [Mytilus coruscus]|uniref:Anaphase-promoting complex subunit 4-like WD40 domain-containing protein n=1 Tax=Mytilus coruscus TaxID=42192 RepID=A0A6J8D7F0_MYTCO|nr:unnamed protein product [Mytilus coruscus]